MFKVQCSKIAAQLELVAQSPQRAQGLDSVVLPLNFEP
jgi:hypothetical protein